MMIFFVIDDGGGCCEMEGDGDGDGDDLLFFLEPPPTGTFLKEPPSVQYLLQVLQKYLG